MAASLNKVFLIGRLGQDPRLAYTASGMPVVNFSMATDEGYTDREGNRVERTEWHRIVVFNKQAEFCANYLTKGRLVFVEGRLQTRKWQDQQGQDKYTTEIVASRVQALDPKGQQGETYATAPDPVQEKAKENNVEEELGPAFPSEAGGMDDAPF
ncbi:single-stranded DNA-binding protein [Desulfohalobiaceae bacterium Ax17]|jgi:single-strand DNA-binding protein|uniref:single-stranded DNA-binding protein n=1 Tax=Desulfovulcanus ferrireducens TaxID=2831190 RepID=UPI00207BBC45|nr:single-stranded DNA-binding protein [Desulfovulcanus ferrireducens]MBT8763752.1 single-stranded DNA-binding protein [Desulfovulcanus ferrireducens]